MAGTSSLETELLRVFKLALAEQRSDVGELLLQALEKMCSTPDHSAIQAAYREIGRPGFGQVPSEHRIAPSRKKLVM